jgi:hypothetical protein
MNRNECKDLIVHRMRHDLKYKSVKAWQIFNRQDGGATMYYMIHATDHPDAPGQMSRAYRHVVRPDEIDEQTNFEFIYEPMGPSGISYPD